MLAIGLGLHQKQTAVAVLDMDTGEVRQCKVSTEQVVEYLQGLGDEQKRVVMETGGGSLFVARKLLSLGMDVIVVDAFKSHRVAEAMHTAKTTAWMLWSWHAWRPVAPHSWPRGYRMSSLTTCAR